MSRYWYHWYSCHIEGGAVHITLWPVVTGSGSLQLDCRYGNGWLVRALIMQLGLSVFIVDETDLPNETSTALR
jgi:hypothetical protein